MPKIRALVSRLYGSDREKSQQAQNRLLNIDDPDAIPALSTHLGSSRDDEARHLYVVILHNMKGPKPVYYLVALSLFDSSPQIRSEARKAHPRGSARLGAAVVHRRSALGPAAIGTDCSDWARRDWRSAGRLGPVFDQRAGQLRDCGDDDRAGSIWPALQHHCEGDARAQFFRNDLQCPRFRDDLHWQRLFADLLDSKRHG